MYTVGQVLFVVLSKKNQVYPMRVVEVITKKTLQGEATQYALQAGSDPSSTVMYHQIDGEVFDTAEVARATLIKRATNQVNKIVDSAILKSKEWYGTEATPEVKQGLMESLPDYLALEDTPTASPPESSTVMLPDGTVAKIKLPSV
jgi:hypothetical protein